VAEASTTEPARRDFLILATGAMGAVGAAGLVWPFISQMNPDASALALASVEVNVSSLEPGQSMKVKWRGKSVFVRYRTEKEIADALAVPVNELPDTDARNQNLPGGAEATDENRSVPGREAWLVMLGVCTHLGCVPIADEGNNGDYGGWFCPCHGSHYDTAGRIRKGPAPENLHIPHYEFLSEDLLKIG